MWLLYLSLSMAFVLSELHWLDEVEYNIYMLVYRFIMPAHSTIHQQVSGNHKKHQFTIYS